jgi:sulfide:quinone oxidoreductase
MTARALPRVVVAGGGVAALEVLLALHKLAAGLLAIELLCPDREFAYRPLAVKEPFELGEVPHFELGPILREQGAAQIADALAGVDLAQRRISTRGGKPLPYDFAVIAVGARPEAAVDGAITFTGSANSGELTAMLRELERGEVRDVAFVVPAGIAWSLPLYELALMTSEWLAARDVTGARLCIVTAEQAPLRLFGNKASTRVASMLDRHGIELWTSCHVSAHETGSLELVGDGTLRAERVVAVPRLSGREIDGLPADANGFLRTDGHGLVEETRDVYAAGDITSFPVKQGGIASQQADAVAYAIAAQVGADVEPEPFRPVLRGLMLSETGPNYLRAEIVAGSGDSFDVSSEPLWWPAGKIAGRYLSPYLAGLGVTAAGKLARS